MIDDLLIREEVFPPKHFLLNRADAIPQLSQTKLVRDPALSAFKRALVPLTGDDEKTEYLAQSLSSLSTDSLLASVTPPAQRAMNGPEVFDAYFHVRRVREPSPEAFVTALVVSYRNLTDDAASGHSLIPIEWGLLSAAYMEIAALLGASQYQHNEASVDGGLTPGVPIAVGATLGKLDPIRRWYVGHHVFFVLIQGILLGLCRFRQFVAQKKIKDARIALSSAAVIMWGTSAAMRFTGDFDPESYDSVVRPSMEAVAVDPGFSGLMSSDHEELVAQIRELKPVIDSLPPRASRERTRFLRAYEASCNSHQFVCARFGGDVAGSLRTDKTAVDVLEAMKKNRCAAWGAAGANAE